MDDWTNESSLLLTKLIYWIENATYTNGLDSLGSTNISFRLPLLGVGVNRTMPFCLLGCLGVTFVWSFASSSPLRFLKNVGFRGGLGGLRFRFGVGVAVALQVTFFRVLCGEAKKVMLSFRFGMRNSATLCRLLGVRASINWRSGAVEQCRRPCQFVSFAIGTTRTLILLSLIPSLSSYC